jgi:hypothetical protein
MTAVESAPADSKDTMAERRAAARAAYRASLAEGCRADGRRARPPLPAITSLGPTGWWRDRPGAARRFTERVRATVTAGRLARP